MPDVNYDDLPIDPAAEWADIPMLSTQFSVLGGPTGPSNAQAIALTKRLKYLAATKGSSADVATALADAFQAALEADEALTVAMGLGDAMAANTLAVNENKAFVLSLEEPDGSKRIGHGGGSVFDALASSGGSFKNKIINGHFLVENRRPFVSGTTLAANEYGQDRWKAGASGCTFTATKVNGAHIFTITAGSIVQVIEGAFLSSGDYKLSWQGTAQGRIDGGAYSEQAVGAGATVTAGTNVTVEFGVGTIAFVQFERGNVATEFEYRPVQIEEALCRRYLYKSSGGGSIRGDQLVFSGNVTSGSNYYAQLLFPVTMRAAPTMTFAINSVFSFDTSLPAFPTFTVRGVLVSKSANATAPGQYLLSFTADAEL